MKQADFNQLARERGYVRRIGMKTILTDLNIEVDEVIDVGVRRGTKDLYDAFPNSRFILVDPQPGGAALLEQTPAHYTFVNVGLAAVEGRGVLNLHARTSKGRGDGKSSLHKRTALTEGEMIGQAEIELTTLDAIINAYCTSDRVGVKLDTEGSELEIIKGLREQTFRVHFILAEVSVLKRFENGYNFSEFVAAMQSIGFVFYRICNPTTRHPRPFLDCLFLRENDPRFLPVST